MATELEVLSKTELHALHDCERTIQRGIVTFKNVGQALMQIRDEHLYRESHESFAAYCKDRWGFARAHAYRLIDAAKVADRVSPMGDNPPNERQARELGRVPEAEQPAVWQEAIDRTEGHPTAAVVREVIEERRSAEEPEDGDGEPQVTCWDEEAEAEAREADEGPGDTDLDDEPAEPNHLGAFEAGLYALASSLRKDAPWVSREIIDEVTVRVYERLWPGE